MGKSCQDFQDSANSFKGSPMTIFPQVITGEKYAIEFQKNQEARQNSASGAIDCFYPPCNRFNPGKHLAKILVPQIARIDFGPQ